MTTTLAEPLSSPLYTGGGTTVDVPGAWDVALNSHGYMVDEEYKASFTQSWTRESIPKLRPQSDTGSLPSEQSLNPEDFWRRSQESWHKGAGQTYLDRSDSDPARFRTSKGVDPWTRWQLSLLPDTSRALTSTATNLGLAVAGGYLYVIDGAALKFTSSITTPSWTTVTGTPAGAISSICSDGNTIYTAHGTNGIYATTRGAATASQVVTGTVTLVRYVHGRLMAANLNHLYNVVTLGGALPAALLDHPNSDWLWTDLAEGGGYIYAGGYSGDKGRVYKTTIKADGTALDVPSAAMPGLPSGELVRAVYGYLGFVMIGTDKGWRFCTADSAGNLTLGSLVATPAPVYCFDGQDRFFWHGYTNYDTSSTGLGRIDPRAVNQTDVSADVPAYASDLMAAGQGTVTATVTFGGRHVFSVAGLGVYAQSSSLVASGTVDSGLIAYGIPDDKVAMNLDVRFDSLVGSVSSWLATAGGTFVLIGSASAVGDTAATFPAGQTRGEVFEVRQVLARSAGDSTVGPTFTRHTLRANPASSRGEFLYVPVMLDERIAPRYGERWVDVKGEFDFLLGLMTGASLVSFQHGRFVEKVTVEDFQWRPSGQTADRSFENGTMVLKLKRLT